MDRLNALRALPAQAEVSAISTANGLRAYLCSRPEVLAVRRAFESEALDKTSLRKFVNELLAEFQRGAVFPHDTVLAAVAVAIETLPTEFADEFVRDLAQVNIAELPLSARVAKIAVHERERHVTQVTTRHLTVSEPIPTLWGPPRELRIEPLTTDVQYREFRVQP